MNALLYLNIKHSYLSNAHAYVKIYEGLHLKGHNEYISFIWPNTVIELSFNSFSCYIRGGGCNELFSVWIGHRFLFCERNNILYWNCIKEYDYLNRNSSVPLRSPYKNLMWFMNSRTINVILYTFYQSNRNGNTCYRYEKSSFSHPTHIYK